jgi:hypothetical protein
MRCIECEVELEPSDRGWVVVLTVPSEPRIVYCPECLSALIRGATGEDAPSPDKHHCS